MIELRQVSVTIHRQSILDSISLAVEPEDFWLVLGPNGAGKTTLLKTLAGIGCGYSGSITWEGCELRDFTPRTLARKVVYLAQEEIFSLPVRVRDLLEMGRYPYQGLFSRFTPEDRRIFVETVSRFDLQPLLERNIQSLSGGEKKKVLIASALIQDVPTILLDEPFSFLDPQSTTNLLHLIRELSGEKKTVIVVSHAIDRLFPMANKLLLLKNGRCLYAGKKVFDETLLRETYEVGFRQVRLEQKEYIITDV